MATVNVNGLVLANGKRWDAKKLKPSFGPLTDKVARRLIAPGAKNRYQSLQRMTGVPWGVIAVIHERESSQRWDRSIAQGDPWNKVSVNVPKGRGPFTSFESAALDALQKCAPFAARWKDWTAGGSTTLLELYNGLGYYKKLKPSPYIWSGTDQYARGKYVRDGIYDPNVVDSQLGCAILLARMQELDPDVKFDEPKKPIAEAATATITATGTAAEATRQTAPVDAAVETAKQAAEAGLPWGRILLVTSIALVAGLVIYFVVRFIKQNKPIHVEDLAREHRVDVAGPEGTIGGQS